MIALGKYLLLEDLRTALIVLSCVLLALFAPLNVFVLCVFYFLILLMLSLITLQKGYKSTCVLLVFLCLPGVAFFVARHWSELYHYLVFLIECVLIILLALALRHRIAWHWVLELGTLFGMLAVIVIHLLFPNIHHIWVDFLKQYPMNANPIFHLNLNVSEKRLLLDYLGNIATGMSVFGVLAMLFLILFVSRFWQSMIYPDLVGFWKEVAHIRISHVFGILILLLTAGLFLKLGYVADIYPVVVFPFMFSGLSVLHCMANRGKWSKRWSKGLIFIYIAVLCFSPMLLILLLAVMGTLDTFCHFRKRYTLVKV